MRGKAYALHIGVDFLDPSAYEGWDGRLAAAENDANAMATLTSGLGYQSRRLLSADATAGAVLDAVRGAAQKLDSGDIFVLTYAGHGGQFADLTGDEQDRLDETWLLHDREILDDEINAALGDFRSGVRILMISDSCHSGTVARNYYKTVLTESSRAADAYTDVAPRLVSRERAKYQEPQKLKVRQVPPSLQNDILKRQFVRYQSIRAATPKPSDITVQASVILIAGCQDNQVSLENNGHGVFTAALLACWNQGQFRGSYRSFSEDIIGSLPPTQSPNFYESGRSWREFVDQRPFTIDPPDGEVATTPSLSGDLLMKPAAYRVEVSLLEPAKP